MILTTHALVGAAIGKKINNLWVVIPVVLVIHFILDSFRHGEYFDSRTATFKNTAWKVILDLSIGSGIILFFLLHFCHSLTTARNVILGAFFSMLPDLTTVLYWKFHWKFLEKIKKFHSFAHRYSRFPEYSPQRKWTFRNAVNDILISAIAIIILFL